MVTGTEVDVGIPVVKSVDVEVLKSVEVVKSADVVGAGVGSKQHIGQASFFPFT